MAGTKSIACLLTLPAINKGIVCNTFPQAKIRDNRTKKYHLMIENLPWNEFDDYEVSLHRVGGQNVSSIHTLQSGRGTSLGKLSPFSMIHILIS